MKRYRATYKSKSGLMYVALLAKDKEDAKKQADEYQQRRYARFPLTFDRLEQVRETGNPGMLAIDPRFTGKALTEAFVKAEVERRKKDQARYDDDDLKLVKIEERN